MFAAIFKILINIFFLSIIGTVPINNDANCSISKIGCNCQNIEIITKDSVKSCCKADLKTLIITGNDVKNISIDIRNSSCSKSFVHLMIQETGIENFAYPFYGLDNITNIYIEKIPNFTDFNKLVFSEINSVINTITVESTILRSIGPKTFSNLPNLVDLKLSDNRIGYIEDFSFNNLPNLSKLYLNNNILTKLKINTFHGLEKLKILSILNNFVLELSADVLKPLKNLQFFHLSKIPGSQINQFGQVPDNVFFSVKRLKHLNMTIKIRNLTSLTFYGLNDLERLELSSNLLTVISPGTFQQVPKVNTIILAKNMIRCLLPETFRSLPKLTSLDLSGNYLSYISDEVFAELITLQTLDLSENNIYVIEKNSFIGLKSLAVFKLNIIHGKAKFELQNNFQASPFAKLRNSTKIIGLMEYFGISKGYGEPPDVSSTVKPISNDTEWKKCPVALSSDKDWVDSTQAGSRKYLLIIVGICVVFLLIAFAIIMSYRAWSKRKMGDLSVDIDNYYEKQEMLVNKTPVVNGRVDNQQHSKSNFTRKSLNGSYMPDVIVDKTEVKTDSLTTSETQQSNTLASVKPATCPLSNERNQSDDESALTPLGVL